MLARRLLVALSVVLLLGIAARPAPTVAAQRGPWGQTLGLTDVARLFTPDSGAFFAAAGKALYRSDDGGSSWRQIELPEPTVDPEKIAIVPANHQIIYVGQGKGVYKTDDDAATWKLVLESDKVRGLAVSAVSQDLVYAQLAGRGQPTGLRQLLVSRDGGASWTEQERAPANLERDFCSWRLDLLAAHPSVDGRVFRAGSCQGGSEAPIFRASSDDGVTWTEQMVPVIVQRLAGGRGADPSLLYIAGRRTLSDAGARSLVYVGDGATWAPIPTLPGIAAGGAASTPAGGAIAIGGLAADLMTSGRLWVAVNRSYDLGGGHSGRGGEVVASDDGGATWTELGGAVLPEVADLALGVDGRTLCAGTAGGVFRLALP